jgi:tetratricopeptide (TPR) repeat protein
VVEVEPVALLDDEGLPQGQVYPERGMMFGFAASGSKRQQVAQIVIERITPVPFLARAETRLPERYAECLADIEQALQLAPDNDRAYWLQAEVMLRLGELEKSVKAARKAIEMAPKQLEYQLTLARALSLAADHAQAAATAQRVAETPGIPTLVLANAYCCWGDCLAAAPERDYRHAIEHHMRAAKLAQPLSKSKKSDLRLAAKKVLLESYLGAACDIGRGNWQQKHSIVPKWLDAAQAVADDIIQHERGAAETRLRLCEAALAALAGVAEPPDATRWIEGIHKLGNALVQDAGDPVYQAHLAWRLGIAFADATEIETARGNITHTLALGNAAMAYFDRGQAYAAHLPLNDYSRGWLCYRMGAVLALRSGDHRQAVAWFQHAVPLLEKPAPPSAVVHPGRHGETFVSMAVSYWELGEQQEAVRLTEQGLQLMEVACADGHLDKGALAVPYGNLARMHEELGNAKSAQEFSELAARAEALGRK